VTQGPEHVDLLFGVQALRRRVERDALAFGGATGLRAAVLPHQLETVRRVLTDVEIRHLIADEVGLGKTVEALMIINALRLQDPLLRVLIVVPNGLSAQWRDELLSRAHEAPIEGIPSPDDQRRVRLAWPQVLTPAEIDPSTYDVLVVDEFHALTRGLQERILSTAAEFQHLLLISATPPFEDPQRAEEVLRMLEPTRARRAAVEQAPIANWSLHRDMRAARTLEGEGDWESIGGSPPGQDAAIASLAHCAYRRVVRTRRDAYRALMPARVPAIRRVEPLEGEIRRQRLMWRYFPFLGELSREFDLDLLAQRVIRSPASLRQRVTYLRGHGHEREGLLEQTAAWLGSEHGDSRFDALCDLLSDLWLAEPDAKVLVAAGDNLTVDDLAKRLPEVLGAVGPLDDERPVVPASIRNQTAGAIELADTEDKVDQAVRAFVVGEANLLIAADVGQLGLNLQVTRHIVLYSVPWDPQQVEQWVGRVDRIGNPATATPGNRAPLPIQVHVIVQRGLVDDRVLHVMEASSVFERSVSLDSAAVRSVREHIREAALGDTDGAGWDALVEEARAIGARVELEDLGSELLPSLPFGPQQAADLHTYLDAAEPISPAWEMDHSRGGFDARDGAVLRWMLAMDHVGEFSVRSLQGDLRSQHRAVRSIQQVVLPTRPPKLMSRARLGLEIFPTLNRKAWFQAGRRALRQPPLRELILNELPHPVHFLDHGSPLHEALCDAWQNLGRQGAKSYRLRLAPGHPAYKALVGKVVYLEVGHLDPAKLIEPTAALGEVVSGSMTLKVADLEQDPRLRAAAHADERFLRAHLPARLLFAAATAHTDAPRLLPRETVQALLAPPPRTGPGLQWSPWTPPPSLRAGSTAALEAVKRALDGAVRATWASRLPKLTEAIAARRYLLRVEANDQEIADDDMLASAEAQLDEAVSELEAAPSPTTRARATRLRRQVEDLERGQELRRTAIAARSRWLASVTARAHTPEYEQYRYALIRVDGLHT
jgi:ATP-dependent helicase HepA